MNKPIDPATLMKMKVKVKGPIRLGVGFRRALYAIALGVWATGGLWLLFHYFLRQQGQFGPQINPLEPWWLKLHGAFAFAALWVTGLLSAHHIGNGWASGRRRWSGVVMLGLCAALIATGYGLYYSGEESIRQIVSYAHWPLGLAAPILFLWHRVFGGVGRRA